MEWIYLILGFMLGFIAGAACFWKCLSAGKKSLERAVELNAETREFLAWHRRVTGRGGPSAYADQK